MTTCLSGVRPKVPWNKIVSAPPSDLAFTKSGAETIAYVKSGVEINALTSSGALLAQRAENSSQSVACALSPPPLFQLQLSTWFMSS